MKKSHFLKTALLLLITLSALSEAQAPDDSNAEENDTLKETLADSISRDSSFIVVKKTDTVKYQADMIEYDIENSILQLTGNGIVWYQNMTLYSDTIHYLIENDIFTATGHPQLIQGLDTVAGEQVVYNTETKRGKVRYASAKQAGATYDGDFLAKSDSNVFYLENADYTTCEVIDSPHYSFYGKKIKVYPSDKAISKPVVLNIGDAPVASLPYMVLPLTKGRQSGVLRPVWGGNPGSGMYMENIGYYWAINDYSDAALSGEVHQFENFIIKANGSYNVRYLLNGSIRGRYSLSTNYDTLSNKWDIKYNHNQNILPDGSMKLSGRGSIVSQSDFYKTFSQDTTELLNQKINANLSLSKRHRRINASTNISWTRDQFLNENRVDQDLPVITFNLPSRPLIPVKKSSAPGSDDETKWYNKISYSYNAKALQKSKFSTLDSLKDDKFQHAGLRQEFNLSYNHKLFKWFNISPNFSINASIFDSYIDTNTVTKRKTVSYSDTLTDSSFALLEDSSAGITDSFYTGDTLLYVLSRDSVHEYKWHDTISFNDDEFDLKNAGTYSWNTGVNLSTKLYGLFPVKLFNFAGIRHTLSPSVGYRFVPRKDLAVSYPSIGIGYSGANKHNNQILNMSLGNLFEGKTVKKDSTGKITDEKVFTIIQANASTSYDFEAKERNLKNLSLSVSNPNPLVNVSLNSNYTFYNSQDRMILPKILSYSISLRPKVLSIRGQLWDGDLIVLHDYYNHESPLYKTAGVQEWHLRINPSYSFRKNRSDPSEEFTTEKNYHMSLSSGIGFTRKWHMSWNGHYDFKTNRFESSTINFECDLECWNLNFSWTPSGYNPGFRFYIGIKELPDIKWEQRDYNRRL